MRSLGLGIVALGLTLGAGAPVLAQGGSPDVARLNDGVGELSAPGALPGPLAVFGEGAFVVRTSRDGKLRLPLIAAATAERGRVVAYGHGALLRNVNDPDNARLLENALKWVTKRPAARIGLEGDNQVLATRVRSLGLEPVTLSERDLASPETLSKLDAVVLTTSALDRQPARIAALGAFVRGGGGLIADSLGWGWLQVNPGRSLARDHGGNALLARFGISWSDGTFDKTGPDGYIADTDADRLAASALPALAILESPANRNDRPRISQASASVTSALSVLPESTGRGAAGAFTARVTKLVGAAGATAVPSATNPVTVANPIARLALVLDQQKIARGGLSSPHPASAIFPGAVEKNAPRVTKTVAIDFGVPNWRSTGLYAAPGETITVTLPPDAVGKNVGVRIGCHTDTLWNLEKWERFPEISVRKPIVGNTITLANPFGGTVYIDVPRKLAIGTKPVTIAGAVEAPRFVRGVTSEREWRETLRNLPGPWAELEGKRVILSVPSATLRALDDPEALLAYWDEMLDNCADLYAIPRDRTRPERFVCDQQISAGYMHSGYPIMTWMDVARRFSNVGELRAQTQKNGSWGFYHEMGHNHQRAWWTFDGTGEVTNNLASLYNNEKLNGQPLGHPAVEPAARRERIGKYLAAGAKFSEWKNDPFLALSMYQQLREAFGWEAFQAVFASYERDAKAAPDRLPKTDDERRDQWMVRFSRQVGKNLAPFFVRWGVPTTESARASLADLPAWPLPEEVR